MISSLINKITKVNPYRKLPANTYVLASYPRSGNTWMRWLLTDLVLQSKGYDTSTELNVNIDEVIPDINNSVPKPEILEKYFKNHATPVVKSHDIYDKHKKKSIYLFRHAPDSLVSYYHFHLRFDSMKKSLNGMDVNDFCMAHLNEWQAHVMSYYKAAKQYDKQVFPFSYEMMHEKPLKVLRIVTALLSINVTDENISTALKNHQFQNHKKREEKISTSKNGKAFRKGKVGSGREELDTIVYQKIVRVSNLTYEKIFQCMPDLK
jgi:hypothetical protein